MNENRQIFTLQQVVSSIRKTIEERYSSTYWIKAEMHKLNLYPSGHAFPELVQKTNGKIVAQINGSIWKHNFQRINQQFITTVKEPLKEGSTLLLNVKIVFSETYGISLQILDIDPSYTLGELQKERHETLLKLKKNGLLNLNQKLSFPLLPKRIAIISADTSKGLSDFMQVIESTNEGYSFFVMLFQAYLQGDNAVASIKEQLLKIERVKHHFDIVVIVRGGGGEVGMSCYNNYELCEAIAQFPLPVLTGIGHSTNLTVAEMIAYRNAITPTELGEFLLSAFDEFNGPLKSAPMQLIRASQQLLEKEKVRFKNETKAFKLNTKGSVSKHRNELVQNSRSINSKSQYIIQNKRNIVDRKQQTLMNEASTFFKEARYGIQALGKDIHSKVDKTLDKNSYLLKEFQLSIRHLDPSNVLKRGYSITRFNGKTISLKNQPGKDALISIDTFDQQITAQVKEIKKLKNEKGN